MKKIFLAVVAWIMPVIAFAVTLWAGSGNISIIREDDWLEKQAKEEKLLYSPEERMRMRARQQHHKR